ncbi:MAG: MBOAT family protein [Alphaproteobacteria bacterium]
MLFHSQVFLALFLPVALIGYHRMAASRDLRICWLIAASLFFYGYWDYRLLPLLAGSIAMNWLLVRLHYRWRLRYLIGIGVFLNLGLIGVFKYADFAASSIAWIAGGQHENWSIILPLGISFFTFQQISYIVDVSRGDAPRYRFHEYALYVSFFPQLIAGPIIRHNEIIFQFDADPRQGPVHENLSRGAMLLLCGLVKKLFIADRLALIANPVFGAAADGATATFADSWMACLAFGLQIYFDFSGYSDMAIGLALMFGLVLPINFNVPYRAASIGDFWRRWHMTLSRFLRDYLYIPLGGNRFGPARQALALAVTMLLGGLWHGAAWTFVVWGGLHGAALGIYHLWRNAGYRMPAAAGWLVTMLFVFATWVIFRAETFPAAWGMLNSMAGLNGLTGALTDLTANWIIPVAFLVAALGPTSQMLVHARLHPNRMIAVAGGLALAAIVLHVGGESGQEFIYFQF